MSDQLQMIDQPDSESGAEIPRHYAAMHKRVPAEVLLAAACSAWPVSTSRIVRLSAQVANWTNFECVVRRNRIAPLVYRALRTAAIEVPSEVLEGLRISADRAQANQLKSAQACIDLQRTFDAAGLQLMVIKGVPLGLLAYGLLAIKESADVDVLVPPNRLADARLLLEEIGYRSELTPDQFERVMGVEIESAFIREETGVVVELHRALTRQDWLLSGVGSHGPAQTVMIGQAPVRTLADEPLFAYLCVHGTTHNWGRLKWLADVHAFVARLDDTRLRELLLAAEGYNAGKSAAVALRLCQLLFGLPLHRSVTAIMQEGWSVRRLVSNAVGTLSLNGGGTEQKPDDFRPWLLATGSRILLSPGLSGALRQLSVTWKSRDDRARLALPERLEFLYHVLRIPLWLGRRGKKVLGALTRDSTPDSKQ